MTDTPDDWRGAEFLTSSFSEGANACVEVALADSQFAMRDSKNPLGPVLAMAAGQGHAFLIAVKREQITDS